MVRIKVTKEAKQKAKEALKFNKKNPKRAVGLTKEESIALGIDSGVQRAKQLIRNKSISIEDARKVRNFYNRFKGCRTRRCEQAINLWGGREYGKFVTRELKNLS